MLPDREDTLEKDFPLLAVLGYTITSPQDGGYNCIAWAAGDNTRWWWPDTQLWGFWPASAPREVTMAAFISAYQSVGFEVCDNLLWEESFEKIAIYTSAEGEPTHAAKQISPEVWSSKCGRNHDITHTLEGLNSDKYGTPRAFMRRKKITI